MAKVDATLTAKLQKVSAKIIDVKLNPKENVCVVSVELTDGATTWHKPFAINYNNKVNFADFKAKLAEKVKEDYSKDTNLSEIKTMEGQAFKLFDTKS